MTRTAPEYGGGWTQRLKMENDTTGGSQHLQSACFSGFSPRQSCNVSFILLQCCCCSPHFLSWHFHCPRMRIQQTLPVVMFPPSFNPQCSSSICHPEKCSATHILYTHTHQTQSNGKYRFTQKQCFYYECKSILVVNKHSENKKDVFS